VIATTTPSHPPKQKNPQDSLCRSYYLKMHGSGFAHTIAHVSVGFGEILTFKPNFGYRYNDLGEEKPVNLSFTE
jgi:hypothetical protein